MPFWKRIKLRKKVRSNPKRMIDLFHEEKKKTIFNQKSFFEYFFIPPAGVRMRDVKRSTVS